MTFDNPWTSRWRSTDAMSSGLDMPESITYWQYGIQYQWGLSWGSYTGHDGTRIDYTEDNVAALAGQNPYFRRKVTHYYDEYGEAERLDTPS